MDTSQNSPAVELLSPAACLTRVYISLLNTYTYTIFIKANHCWKFAFPAHESKYFIVIAVKNSGCFNAWKLECCWWPQQQRLVNFEILWRLNDLEWKIINKCFRNVFVLIYLWDGSALQLLNIIYTIPSIPIFLKFKSISKFTSVFSLVGSMKNVNK